jgi:hypothetical protein
LHQPVEQVDKNILLWYITNVVVYRNNNRLKHWRQGLYGYLVMRKSMDDELLRQQIIEILQNAGSSSTKEDLNLAVMNMLPIPALDGGRVLALLLTVGIEAVTRKKIDPKYEGYIHGAGMVLLLGLMALILFKDVFTIFKG